MKKTFKQLYEEEKKKPTACQQFITTVAQITKRSRGTVKLWLLGYRVPDDLAKEVIAKHFGVDPDGLFPGMQYRHPEVGRKGRSTKPMKESIREQ